MSEHNAWMTFEPGVCAICSEGGEDVYDVCSHKCYVQMYERMLRHNCFRAIVLAACEVAKVQQAMLDRGWIQPDGEGAGRWRVTEYYLRHSYDITIYVEAGEPGTWVWHLQDDRLDRWVVTRGVAATSLEARQGAERALAEYEATHAG